MPIIYKDSDDAANNIVNEIIAEEFVENAQDVAKIINELPDPASADSSNQETIRRSINQNEDL